MPEPVTIGVCTFMAGGAAQKAFHGLSEWLRNHLPKSTDEMTEQEIREQLGAYLQSYGWELKRCPFLKFTSIIPLRRDALMAVLKDPRFDGCQGLYHWVKLKLEQVMKMSAMSGAGMADHCALFRVGQDEHSIESTYGLFWARLSEEKEDECTIPSEFKFDTPAQVLIRLAERVGATATGYQAVMEEMYANGIDGAFLAEEDFLLEELQSFAMLSSLQKKVLRNHFARYKPQAMARVPNVALCIVATTVTLDFNDKTEYYVKNRIMGRVCQEKIMTYLKMRMAAEKPQEILDVGPSSGENMTQGRHLAIEM